MPRSAKPLLARRLRLRKIATETRALAPCCGKFIFSFHLPSIHPTPSRRRELSHSSLRYLIGLRQQAFACFFGSFQSKSRPRQGDRKFRRLVRQPLPEAFDGRRAWGIRDGSVAARIKKKLSLHSDQFHAHRTSPLWTRSRRLALAAASKPCCDLSL